MKLLLIVAMAVFPLLASSAENREYVILLHGLCRTSRSMLTKQRALAQAGYNVLNVDYPSRSASIETLGETAVAKAVGDCERAGAVKIDFVTHSLGGILVRSYLARHAIAALGRVVMLAPPNQGSEVVDKLGALWLFKKINGPAGDELGTGPDSTPNKLGPANFCTGIIAGNRSINWINSLMISGANDGKVSVERTKLDGMAGHIVIPATHPFIMRNRTAIRQTLSFLKSGRFDASSGNGFKPVKDLPHSLI
jgi:pimeloyl-ACP methyl ester carboxylesterase